MYYKVMNSAVKPVFKAKTFCFSKSHKSLIDKEISFVSIKFYQKLFVLFIALSTFLILPESPRELENICESYNAKRLCIIW